MNPLPNHSSAHPSFTMNQLPEAITSSSSSQTLEPQEKKEFDEVSLEAEETPSENTLIAWLQVRRLLVELFPTSCISGGFHFLDTF